MKFRFKWLKKKDEGAIGIGAMIVFIAMVLVAGIALVEHVNLVVVNRHGRVFLVCDAHGCHER